MPIGARGVIAGIPPLRIILDLHLRGLQVRLTTLDDRHIARTTWSLRWINPKIRQIWPRTRPRHLPSDNPLQRLATDAVREQFLPFHATSLPGGRILDLFHDRVTVDSYSPKKGSSLFKAWLSDFAKSVTLLHSSDRPLIFTDGAYWNQSARGTYSFTVYHRGSWLDFFNWCPAGSSFDAEIAAIEEAVQWSCINHLSDPVFFIDNKAALGSFLDTRVRSSQMASIRICEILKDRLTFDPNVRFSFRYCPSHSGIEGNDCADLLTKRGAALAPTPPPRILLSNFVNDYTKCMTTHWRTLFASSSFKGQQWLPLRRQKKVFKPAIRNKAATRFFHDLAGNDIEMLSRMARAITNHAPTGEYRRCFYPDHENCCPSCPQRVQTRTHILFHCPKYTPLHSSMTNWSHDKQNHKLWKAFFLRNPSAFTFGDLPDDVH